MDTQVKIGVVVEEGEEILLIREKYEKKDRALWNIIKGTYGDNGEETIFESAERECREEASVKVKLTGALGTFVYKTEDQMRIQFNFTAKIISGEPKVAPAEEQKSRDEDIQEIRWFTKAELLKMNPEELISNKTYQLIQNWLTGQKYPLDIYQHVQI